MYIYQQLKAMIAAMGDLIEPSKSLPFRQPTPMKNSRPLERQNHGAGESKRRRKMAAASNRVNRLRIKRWKH